MSELFDQDAMFDPNIDRTEFAIREYVVSTKHLAAAFAIEDEDAVPQSILKALTNLSNAIIEEYGDVNNARPE